MDLQDSVSKYGCRLKVKAMFVYLFLRSNSQHDMSYRTRTHLSGVNAFIQMFTKEDKSEVLYLLLFLYYFD